MEILDVYGRKLFSNSQFLTLSNHVINISHLPTGIYFVKIFTKAGEIVKKIVKE